MAAERDERETLARVPRRPPPASALSAGISLGFSGNAAIRFFFLNWNPNSETQANWNLNPDKTAEYDLTKESEIALLARICTSSLTRFSSFLDLDELRLQKFSVKVEQV